MIVTLRTAGTFGVGNYNQSVAIEYDCAVCGMEMETVDGVITHPSEVEEGIFKKKIIKVDCKQAGMKARAAIELPNVP